MSKLTERYPQVRKLTVSEDHDQQRTAQVIAPYLKWNVAEIDVLSQDILLLDSDGPRIRGMVILSGPLAGMWLRARSEVSNPRAPSGE